MLRRLRAALADERGFSMVVVVGTLAVSMIAAMAAISAADGDNAPARSHDDQRRAWEAAQAGIEWYQYQLNRDVSYWTQCDSVPDVAPGQPAPVNQVWDGSGSDPRRFRAVGDARFAVELLPAAGNARCVPGAGAASSMLTGNTMRIRATGRYRDSVRSVVTTFKRPSFLDFLYFTDLETQDPVTYGALDSRYPAWATANCGYWRDGRASKVFARTQSRTYGCEEIQFATADVIDGPLHTNDELLSCGAATFGRAGASVNDVIEVSATSGAGWRQASGCSGSPNLRGTLRTAAPVLAMPPTNAALASVATYTFTGATRITLNGTTMTVVDRNNVTTTRTLASSGTVVYVKNGTCGTTYALSQTYSTPSGCAVLRVKGSYSAPLTLASAGDILVDGNVTATSGTPTAGLIADNFVRVYHPVSGDCDSNATGAMQDVEIDAAILALNHSFLVDNWACGAPLGTLTVKGAIAQKYRGPVGTGSATARASGYTKAYSYDDALRSVEPPAFLDPQQSAWRITREVEQRPATG